MLKMTEWHHFLFLLSWMLVIFRLHSSDGATVVCVMELSCVFVECVVFCLQQEIDKEILLRLATSQVDTLTAVHAVVSLSVRGDYHWLHARVLSLFSLTLVITAYNESVKNHSSPTGLQTSEVARKATRIRPCVCVYVCLLKNYWSQIVILAKNMCYVVWLTLVTYDPDVWPWEWFLYFFSKLVMSPGKADRDAHTLAVFNYLCFY